MKTKLLLITAVLSTFYFQAQTIIADYPLTVNTSDSLGSNGDITLNGVNAPSGSICQDGTYGDYAVTPSLTGLNVSSFQIEVDFNITGLTIRNNPVITGGGGYRWIGIFVNPAGNLSLLYNNATEITSTMQVPLNTWNTAKLQYDTNHVRLYLGSTLVLDQCIGVLTTGGETSFLTTNPGSGQTFNGCLRNLIFSNNVNLPMLQAYDTTSICMGDSMQVGTHYYKMAGTFIDTLSSPNGCSIQNTTVLSVNPSYHLSSTDSVCSGSDYTFADGTVLHNITNAVKHTSSFQTKMGCDSSIVTNISILPTYSLTLTDSVCMGSNYMFADGSIQSNITSTAMHTSNLVTNSGCDSIIVTTVNVILMDTSVTVMGDTLSSNASGATFQWIDCGNNNVAITGEISAKYIAAQPGSYAVIVTKNGCSYTSKCNTVVVTGINPISAVNSLSVYPNPNNGLFNLVLNDLDGNATITISDISGRVVYVKSISVNKSYTEIVDLSGLAKGVYTLQFKNSKSVLTNKLLIN
jgi:hypothetical protein